MSSITIIGSGLAGYTLAREFRKLDKQTPLRIITADNGDFYSKPMLSNALSKQQTPEQLVNTPAAQMAEKENIDIISQCTVEGINREQQTLHTSQGEFSYSELVLCNGANQIKLNIDGDATDDVMRVNSLQDYDAFYQQLQGKKHIVIMGAGLIGCEFANDLSNAGYQVSLVDLASQPLGRLLPERAAADVQAALSAQGIDWYLDNSVSSIDHSENGYRVELCDNTTLQADLVLSAVGLSADTRLAEAAGLACQRGIVVNEIMQSSDSHIYALGDCAEINGQLLPYVMPIMIGARALAKTLHGERTAVNYPAMPVMVKTPACPVVVCPPPVQQDGEWFEEIIDGGVRSLFKHDDSLLGFALTGSATAEKQQLTRALA
jgi:rubredoxin-NAD+ reductase